MNMRTSEATDLLDAALAKAQAELTNPVKEATNPHFRSRYATLDAGLNIVRECLSKNGISFTQPTRVEDSILILETRLAHEGQWIVSEYPVCTFPVKHQEMGSALTYARRYSLFSLVGIAGEEDDDANAAASPTGAPRRVPTPPKPPSDTFDVEASQLARDMLLSAIEMAESVSDLQKWQVDNNATIAKLLEADKQVVRDAFGDKRQALRGKEQAA
jgi:hypothetical protein